MAEAVTVRSSGGMIELWLDDSISYAELRERIIEKLDRNKRFYMGTANPVMLYGKQFSAVQKRELRALLEASYAFRTVDFVDDEAAPEPKKEKEAVQEQSNFEEQSVLLVETVRNGQRIVSEGDIIIAGDVNAGAELLAGGNIAVFGKLRGLAHAGIGGKKEAYIIANELSPSQIRIGTKVAILPKRKKIEGTELARLEKDKIVIQRID